MASYSPQTISHLVSYANSRGVRIVPEFDTPGHTAAVGQAYPELIADCYDWLTEHYDSELRWSMWDSVAMDVTKQETKDFVQDVMTEMSSLFPDQYFHVCPLHRLPLPQPPSPSPFSPLHLPPLSLSVVEIDWWRRGESRLLGCCPFYPKLHAEEWLCLLQLFHSSLGL
jgi:hypothetical protein